MCIYIYYTCLSLSLYIYIHIYICIFVHIYIYIYTYISFLNNMMTQHDFTQELLTLSDCEWVDGIRADQPKALRLLRQGKARHVDR